MARLHCTARLCQHLEEAVKNIEIQVESALDQQRQQLIRKHTVLAVTEDSIVCVLCVCVCCVHVCVVCMCEGGRESVCV